MDCFQDFVQEEPLRQRPFDLRTFVDDGLRNCVDAVLGCPIGELRGLNGVGADVVILHRELICQSHGPRAVRAGRSDKHFEVEGLGKFGELLSTSGIEA